MFSDFDEKISSHIHTLNLKWAEILIFPFGAVFQPFLCCLWPFAFYCLRLAQYISALRHLNLKKTSVGELHHNALIFSLKVAALEVILTLVTTALKFTVGRARP
jgi:hypothetical protein